MTMKIEQRGMKGRDIHFSPIEMRMQLARPISPISDSGDESDCEEDIEIVIPCFDRNDSRQSTPSNSRGQKENPRAKFQDIVLSGRRAPPPPPPEEECRYGSPRLPRRSAGDPVPPPPPPPEEDHRYGSPRLPRRSHHRENCPPPPPPPPPANDHRYGSPRLPRRTRQDAPLPPPPPPPEDKYDASPRFPRRSNHNDAIPPPPPPPPPEEDDRFCSPKLPGRNECILRLPRRSPSINRHSPPLKATKEDIVVEDNESVFTSRFSCGQNTTSTADLTASPQEFHWSGGVQDGSRPSKKRQGTISEFPRTCSDRHFAPFSKSTHDPPRASSCREINLTARAPLRSSRHDSTSLLRSLAKVASDKSMLESPMVMDGVKRCSSRYLNRGSPSRRSVEGDLSPRRPRRARSPTRTSRKIDDISIELFA